MWMEMVMVYSKVIGIFQYLDGGTEENYETPNKNNVCAESRTRYIQNTKQEI
jgi:hypothetical protein